MRYYTKELQETIGKRLCYGLIKVSKKAESFDEKFFRELYNQKLDWMLESDKKMSEMKFEDLFPEFDPFEFEDETAYEQARREFKPVVFTEEWRRQNFAEQYRSRVRHLKSVLPEEILSKVADIRVLALDVASAEVKRLVTAFSKKYEREVRRVLKEFHKAEEREFGGNFPEFYNISLHDCTVLSCCMRGKDLVLKLDNYGGFTSAVGVIFKNAEIIEREERLAGAKWLFSEIYKCERGLEIHAMLIGNDYKYLTLQCEDTEFVYDDSEEV